MEGTNPTIPNSSPNTITSSAEDINISASLLDILRASNINAMIQAGNPDETANFTEAASTNASLILEALRPKVGVTQMILHTVFESFIALAICLGNIVVLLAVWRHRSLHSVTNIFIVSLGISDLCMGLFASPLSIIDNFISPLVYGYYVQNKWLCASKQFSLAVSGGGTLISLFGIAFDRYIAVLRPLKYHTTMTRTRVAVFLGCMWMTVFCSSLPIFSSNVLRLEPLDMCRSDEILNEVYALYMKVTLGIFFVPTSSLHITVSVVALKHRKRIASELACFNNNMAVAYRKENRITKTIFLVMAVFVLFWLPWCAIYSVKFKTEPKWFTATKYASVSLYVSNSAVNPWIYAYRSKGMRQAIGNIIKCKWNSHISLE